MPDADFWNGPALQAGQVAQNWNVDVNWSLNRKPTANDDAVFSADWSTVPCILNGGDVANPLSVTLAANLPANLPANSPILTVAGILQTATLDVKARAGAGIELVVAQFGQIGVTGTMWFSGGNISGNGAVTIVSPPAQGATAFLHIGPNMSAADLPTLGVNLQLGGTVPGNQGMGDDGGGGGVPGAGNVVMDYNGAAAQPLVVTGNGDIWVNAGASLLFDSLPLQGNAIATAISNGDAGLETICINDGGLVRSDGAVERTVGMGVQLDTGGQLTGDIPAGAGAGSALDFTGKVAANSGLQQFGGTLTVQGGVTFDNGGDIAGGTVNIVNGTLTLGQNAASPPSHEMGGTINLVANLVAHGGLQMSSGTLNATAGRFNTNVRPTVTVDTVNGFQLSGGSILVTDVDAAVGYLRINGNFGANGGNIYDNVSMAGETQGYFEVTGNVTLTQQCTFWCRDVAPQAGVGNTWTVFSYGSRTGGGRASAH